MSHYQTAVMILGYNGINLGPKVSYVKLNPNNIVVFNSQLVVDGVKIWTGDLDITLSYRKLHKLSKLLGKSIYIYRENERDYDPNKSIMVIDENKINFTGAFKLIYSVDKNGRPTISEIEEIKGKTAISESPISSNNIVKTVKLPVPSRIKAIDGHSILETFMKSVLKFITIDEYENFYVSCEYAIALMDKIQKNYKKMFPKASQKDIEEMAAWEWFEFGPKHFNKDPEWVDMNIGYVIK